MEKERRGARLSERGGDARVGRIEEQLKRSKRKNGETEDRVIGEAVNSRCPSVVADQSARVPARINRRESMRLPAVVAHPRSRKREIAIKVKAEGSPAYRSRRALFPDNARARPVARNESDPLPLTPSGRARSMSRGGLDRTYDGKYGVSVPRRSARDDFSTGRSNVAIQLSLLSIRR